MNQKSPIIVVIGNTGAGKSRMAVDVALACNGEVINADAMQIYCGLDIITNKMTKEEMRNVKHHLMGFKEPGEESFVGEWVAKALESIEEIYSRGRIPVIVGGTTYWIQNLLFPNRIVTENKSSSSKILPSKLERELQIIVDGLPPAQLGLFNEITHGLRTASMTNDESYQLWKLLESLDPDMASRWHWKDSRKVVRNLEIIVETGKRASDIVKSQDVEPLDSRFRTLLLWPYTKPEVLNPRLDKRVDEMVERGLLDEIRSLHKTATEPKLNTNGSIDYESSIFQSIGFKEFNDYLSTPSDDLFKKAVEEMKRATQKYANYQIKWIRKKLLPAIRATSDTEIYLFDTADVDNWATVEAQSVKLASAFLSKEELPPPAEITPLASSLLPQGPDLLKPSDVLIKQRKMACDICTASAKEPFLVNADEWNEHTTSRGHRQKVKTREKRARNDERRRWKESRIHESVESEQSEEEPEN